ncbi:12701_t:CDS:2 [Funneliformis caledonium]|uniref:12701_t:CDS:1 n=1 Tax=Funneliformis caledonium TaxID=1117310 RepID=A0A9N9FPK4_9GLOM|nr:12701_t:CDS:2 [Funneliformis caledonium]
MRKTYTDSKIPKPEFFGGKKSRKPKWFSTLERTNLILCINLKNMKAETQLILGDQGPPLKKIRRSTTSKAEIWVLS